TFTYPIGTQVSGYADVSDPDSPHLSYSLTNDPSGLFAIDEDVGTIYMLDRANIPTDNAVSYSIGYQVSDGEFTANGTITITYAWPPQITDPNSGEISSVYHRHVEIEYYVDDIYFKANAPQLRKRIIASDNDSPTLTYSYTPSGTFTDIDANGWWTLPGGYYRDLDEYYSNSSWLDGTFTVSDGIFDTTVYVRVIPSETPTDITTTDRPWHANSTSTGTNFSDYDLVTSNNRWWIPFTWTLSGPDAALYRFSNGTSTTTGNTARIIAIDSVDAAPYESHQVTLTVTDPTGTRSYSETFTYSYERLIGNTTVTLHFTVSPDIISVSNGSEVITPRADGSFEFTTNAISLGEAQNTLTLTTADGSTIDAVIDTSAAIPASN
ncbi:MAG: cadherin repeat domain-containing protein, partial [Planctomycetota bacterium]